MPPEQDTQEQGAAPDLGGSLDGLLAQAEAIEAANTPPDPGAQQAEQAAQLVASAAEELFGALEMLRMMAAPMMAWWPKFGEVWNDSTLRQIAAGGAAVMQRHGWTLGDAWGQFGPYIALIGATLPPSLVTWAAIQERRAELARPQRRQQPQHEDAEGVRP